MDEENKLPEPTIEDLKEQIEEMTIQRDEYLAGWQRAKADFINYKKEEMKQLQDVSRYTTESIVKELLSVLHTFDLAIQNLLKKATQYEELDILRSQLWDVLRKKGVEKIELSPGDLFDPATAEALLEVESHLGPPGTIVEIMEPGYRLYDKVIRAAKVSVSKDKN